MVYTQDWALDLTGKYVVVSLGEKASRMHGEGDGPHRWENWDPSAMVRNEEWQNQRYYEKMSNHFLKTNERTGVPGKTLTNWEFT